MEDVIENDIQVSYIIYLIHRTKSDKPIPWNPT